MASSAKRGSCKCPPEGAPEWMTTYGDMMTLLLCFFVLIVSFSEIKKEEEFHAVVREIKQAFGIHGGGGKIPVTDDPTLSLIERLDLKRLSQEKIENKANTREPGQKGKEAKVTKIREGMLIGAGGRITFQPGSAVLSGTVMTDLASLVEEAKIRGTENVLELRGHADALELPEGGNGLFDDAWDLSTARAKAVFEYMTRPAPDGLGIAADRFRLSGNGSREPLNRRAYTTDEAAGNRRVEVLVSETLVPSACRSRKALRLRRVDSHVAALVLVARCGPARAGEARSAGGAHRHCRHDRWTEHVDWAPSKVRLCKCSDASEHIAPRDGATLAMRQPRDPDSTTTGAPSTPVRSRARSNDLRAVATR